MDRPERPLDPLSEPAWLPSVTWLVIVLAACAVFFGNLRFGNVVLSIGLEDDFFYYAQVARNLAFHGIASFDGTHLTNGYHPLWLLVVTALTKVFDIGGLIGATSVYPMAIAIETVQLALIVAVAFYSFRIVRLYCGVAASCTVQLLAVTGALMIVRGGMEAGLSIALAFALLWYRLQPKFDWSPAMVVQYGMLASLLALSRLDSLILVGLLFVFEVLANGPGFVDRAITGLTFLVGLWPLGVYALVNYLIFEVVIPVSASAKEMRDTRLPSLEAMQSFAGRLLEWRLPVYAVCVALTLAIPVLLWMKKRTSPKNTRGIFWAVLVFPLAHFLVVAILSDWMIWPWYVYAWPIAGTMAAILFLRQSNASQTPGQAEIVYFGLALLLLAADAGFLVHSSRPEDELTYLAGQDIAKFAETHPGIYGMGDRAGAVGYLSKQPLVQMEGLMEDSAFLEFISTGKNVKDALNAYHVRYYITTGATVDNAGCYATREPAQAGADSAAMRTLICQAPVAKFEHRGFVNLIFDMQ